MENKSAGVFSKKIWMAGSIILFLVLSVVLFIYTFNLWLLLMSGVVLAVYLRLIANKIHRWTGWKDMVCFVLSIIITLGLLGGLSFLIGNRLQDQYTQLEKRWPQMKEKAADYMKDYPVIERTATKFLGQDSVDQFNKAMKPDSAAGKAGAPQNADAPEQMPTAAKSGAANQQAQKQASPDLTGKLGKTITGLFQSTFGLLGDLYVVLFLGLFLALNPAEYRDGIVSLIPGKGKDKARNVLNTIGGNLGKWFKGMTFSVLITFAMTAIGLLAIGQDLWLILAIIAGLLTFIPNFGPIIALIPASLVGLIDSPKMALYIIILYMAIQFVESNIITPMIQKKMIKTPPALLLFFQMLMGAAGSGWGVVMATPVLVVFITLVQELYLNKKDDEQKENSVEITDDSVLN